MILCALDVLHIQTYVFRSNRLQDVVGGSLLVEQSLDGWLREVLEHLDRQSQLQWNPRQTFPDFWRNPAGRAHVVLASGGRAMLLLDDESQARALISCLSWRVLSEAPGLELGAVWVDVSPSARLCDLTKQATQALEHQKHALSHRSIPELPGVLERCVMTRQPAVEPARLGSEPARWTSAELLARRQALQAEGSHKPGSNLRQKALELSRRGHPVLAQALERMKALQYAFSNDVEMLRGNRDEHSYLAVLHLDANRMGQRLRGLEQGPLEEAVPRLQAASRHVEAAAFSALGDALHWLLDLLSPQDGPSQAALEPLASASLKSAFLESASTGSGLPLDLSKYRETSLRPDPRTGDTILPVRPVLLAGDDLTLIVEGALAPDFAWMLGCAYQRRLRAWHEHGERPFPDLPFKDITASVGVGLGRARQPFSQLYDLASQACTVAKKAAQARKNANMNESFLAFGFLDDAPRAAEAPHRTFLYRLEPASRPQGGMLPLDWLTFRREVLTPMQEAPELRGQLHALGRALSEKDPEQALKRLRALWSAHGVEEPVSRTGILHWLEEFPDATDLIAGQAASSEKPACSSPYLDALSWLRIVPPLTRPKYKEQA